jgi:hypothetical protein
MCVRMCLHPNARTTLLSPTLKNFALLLHCLLRCEKSEVFVRFFLTLPLNQP